ncbi:MAG: type II CRISPR-associated endonuclease Cas1 [Mycoplasmatota bacterium]
MSFRTVIISKQSRLSYKNRCLVVKQDLEEKYIHLSEIDTIVVDSIAVSISTFLLKELSVNKINLICCDEKHNPFGEFNNYYMSHNSSKKIYLQVKWSKDIKDKVWTNIIKDKIINQAQFLNYINSPKYDLLVSYIPDIMIADKTNREGMAAKVYFNELFGKKFTRHSSDDINHMLNYGYSILLSTFNKEIFSLGYITQLGIHHKNEFNNFNLSCDLMESFRVIIDSFVYSNQTCKLDTNMKYKIIDLFNNYFLYNGKSYTLKDIIKMYVKNIFDFIESDKPYIGFKYEK